MAASSNLKINITAVFTTLIFSGVFLGFTTARAEDRNFLAPPSFISPKDFYPIEEVFYIEGRAEPSAIVTVLLQKAVGSSLPLAVQASASGEWSIAKKIVLESGTYEILVRQQLQDLVSDWSSPQLMQSIVTGIHFFSWNILYTEISLVLLIIFIPIAIVFSYFFWKYRALKLWIKNKNL